jgi:exodeoxyribonuclease VII large subunit
VPKNDKALEALQTLCKSVGGGKFAAKLTIATTAVTQTTSSNVSQGAEAGGDLTIRELVVRTEHALRNLFPNYVWITGEIQNLNWRGQGIFFQLAEPKDDQAAAGSLALPATLWSSTHESLAARHGKDALTQVLADGLKVRLKCQVTFYKDRGQLSLQVRDIDLQYSKGLLALAREALLKELRALGLAEKNKSLTLSPFPFKVGLVSADNSRAKSDFTHQLYQHGFPGEIVFVEAQMQGEQAVTSVVTAIKALEEQNCDVIVLTRGGGSASDLRWFDHRDIAMAIVQCRIPIVAAIGHQDDVCVAEEISFRREKTPTAAAEFLLKRFRETSDLLSARMMQFKTLVTKRFERHSNLVIILKDRLRRGAQNALSVHESRVARYRQALMASSIKSLHVWKERYRTLLQKVSHGAQRFLEAKRQEVSLKERRIFHHASIVSENLALALSKAGWRLRSTGLQFVQTAERTLLEIDKELSQNHPDTWRRNGLAKLFKGGKRLSSVGDAKKDDEISATLTDGKLSLKILEIHPTIFKENP